MDSTNGPKLSGKTTTFTGSVSVTIGNVVNKVEYRFADSGSHPHVRYTVTRVNGRSVSCTCELWRSRIQRPQSGTYVCDHMRKIDNMRTAETHASQEPKWYDSQY